MISMQNSNFFEQLDLRSKWMKDYILHDRFVSRFHPEDIRWAVTSYVTYGGKRLRPAILLFSCGAVGGDEQMAIPAAAAVEIFHTWTLVHDDIIDRDPLRRGSATVHQHYTQMTRTGSGSIKLSEIDASHYGNSIAILTGDIQHGWGISMMAELSTEKGLDANVTLDLINELDTRVLNTLVEGEVLDIQYAHFDIESLSPEKIERMLWKKTGALYEFCGRAGAMIGLQKRDDPLVDAVANFATLCGTAFQLQDDILGIVGKEKSLGKPVGSDLREGKRTLVLYRAYHNASPAQQQKFMHVLGNPEATNDEVIEIIDLMRDLGGVDWVKDRATKLIENARKHLEILPESRYKDLLWQWSEFMINREF